MRKLLALIVLGLCSAGANATVWNISGGSLVSWDTDGTNGVSSQNVYEGAPGPSFAGSWDPSAVTYSGSLCDTCGTGTFSWTGESGSAAKTSTGFELFSASIAGGTYDIANGQASGTFACWNNPSAVAVYGADFCGNGTGGGGGGTPQVIQSRWLDLTTSGGGTTITDNLDGTITVVMVDTTYTDCVAAGGAVCIPDSNTSDTTATWLLSATAGAIPVPAAVWLFGSALGLLGWIRRRAS